MSDIFESIKQSAGQVLSGIDQKGQLKSALDGIRHQWNELERRRKQSSLGDAIKAQQGEMKQLTEALGLQTLSLYDAGKVVHPELARLCERINELRAEIEAKKGELEALQAQAAQQAQATTQCANCRAQVPAGAEFCPQCGAPLKAAPQPAAQAPALSPSAPTAAPARTVVRFRCPRCKTELSAGDDFCPACGVKIVRPAPQTRAGAPVQGPSPAGARRQPQAQPPTQVGGQAAPAGIRFCPSCGAETKPNAQFCPICGQALH
jgi:membrane protease subunit (stomatin/prohibitin family)